jgi:hypothetical protein
MNDITISDINKDDITISDINKDDIIGGSNTKWVVLVQDESESESGSDGKDGVEITEKQKNEAATKFQKIFKGFRIRIRNYLLKFNLSEEKKEEFERNFPDHSYNNSHIDDIVKILITNYDAVPKLYKRSQTEFRIIMEIFNKKDHVDIACIKLEKLEIELFEIIANNYNITDILDRSLKEKKEKNGIDYNWFSNNIKEIHVIKNNLSDLNKASSNALKKEYKEKDSRKFNKYIEHFIKYYKQDDNFNGLSIYKNYKEYNLIIYLKK